MLTAILLCASASQATPGAAFDEAIRAHARLSSGRVRLTTVGDLGRRLETRYDLSFIQPDRLKIRIEERHAGKEPTDRTYALLGGRAVGYDAIAHERLSRPAGTGGSLLDRVETAIGTLDEPVRALLDAAACSQLLERFKTLQGWSRATNGQRIVVKRFAKQGSEWSRSVWEFDSTSRLIRRVEMDQPRGSLVWRFDYDKKPAAISFQPPRDAFGVKAFSDKPPLPARMDAASREALRKARRAFSRLRHARAIIRDGAASAEVRLSGNRVAQIGPSGSWAYDGANLAIDAGPGKPFYRGVCGLAAVPKLLESAKVDMDALAWQYAARRDPIAQMLSSDVSVRSAGTVRLEGATCSIIEIRSADFHASVFVRSGDGLLAGVHMRRFDAMGAEAFRTERAIRYASVGKPLPASTFTLSPGPGRQARPLPRKKP